MCLLTDHSRLVVMLRSREGRPGSRLRSRAGKGYIGAVTGDGVLDYPAIIAELEAMNYQGYLSFEYEGPDDPVEMTRKGMEYLAGLMG